MIIKAKKEINSLKYYRLRCFTFLFTKSEAPVTSGVVLSESVIVCHQSSNVKTLEEYAAHSLIPFISLQFHKASHLVI